MLDALNRLSPCFGVKRLDVVTCGAHWLAHMLMNDTHGILPYDREHVIATVVPG